MKFRDKRRFELYLLVVWRTVQDWQLEFILVVGRVIIGLIDKGFVSFNKGVVSYIGKTRFLFAMGRQAIIFLHPSNSDV